MIFKNLKNKIEGLHLANCFLPHVKCSMRAFTPTPTFTIGHGISLAFISLNIFKCSFFYKRKLVRGFTLIESMVGILIIVTAITGPLSVAISSATYAKDTKDKITAIYLAQEAVDVLRFERDSLLIKCSQNNVGICPQYSLNDGVNIPNYVIDSYETTANAAWRIFKKSLDTTPSCFINSMPNATTNGCSFDFYGFTQNPVTPIKYLYTGNTDENCNYLYRDATSAAITGGAYLCSANGSGSTFNKTKFSRVIKLTHFNTVTTGNQYYQDYNDDVRVNVTVSYAKSYGIIKSVEVVDFLHAKI